MNETPTPSRRPPDESPIEARLAAMPVWDPAPEADKVESKTPTGGFFGSKGAVIAILFLVTGCLGVPLLWANNRFGKTERWFWTIASTLYTALLLGIVYLVLMWSYRQIVGG